MDFLIIQLGYKRTYAYELLDLARKRIGEIFREEHEDAYEAAVGRIQEIIETASSEKIRLEATKELHRIQGIYRPVKVEVSGKVEHQITAIEINIVTPNIIDITPEVKKIDNNNEKEI